jgi:hypothetical protein
MLHISSKKHNIHLILKVSLSKILFSKFHFWFKKQKFHQLKKKHNFPWILTVLNISLFEHCFFLSSVLFLFFYSLKSRIFTPHTARFKLLQPIMEHYFYNRSLSNNHDVPWIWYKNKLVPFCVRYLIY